ncbi:centrosomal protein of 126 kDa [Pelodytes ibericus]
MQNRHSKSYSNLKTQLEIDLEEERQALLEDQKIYRIRAQKLSNETNRRRKALEEKRKDEEEKEQKFREEVLHQRKQKLQEATEKFQRGHLPLFQRRRTAYVVHRKNTPKLEDALDQIQGPISSTFYYISNHRNHTSTRTTDTPSSLLSGGSGTGHKKQQPASKLGFERTFQEPKSVIKCDSNRLFFQHKLEEAQRLLEEQHLSNLQNFHQEANQLAHSESLSSLDSLEEELEEKEPINVLEDFISQNLCKALLEVTPQTVNNSIPEVDYNDSHPPKTISPLNSQNSFTASPHLCYPDQMPTANYPHNQVVSLAHRTEQAMANSFILNGMTHGDNVEASSIQNQENVRLLRRSAFGSEAGNSDLDYIESTSSHFVIKPCKAWATPNPTPKESGHCSVTQENKEPIQHTENAVKIAVTQPLAAPLVLPNNEWEGSAKMSHDGVSTNSKKYINSVHSIAGTELTGTNNEECYSMSNEHITCPESNSHGLPVRVKTELMSSLGNKDFEDDQNISLSRAILVNADSEPGFIAHHKKTRLNVSGKDGNKSLKSILKKGSKYENGYTRAMGIGKMFHIVDRGNSGVRDSVELAKEKESKKGSRKKLRWLDEIDKIVDENDYISLSKHLTGIKKTAAESSSNTSHQGYAPTKSLVEPTEHSSEPPSSVFSTGYHFTRQAWVTSKGAETNSVDHNHNTRSLPKAKTKVVRRPKSARNPSAVTHRNRKGTIIRPQSATEASMIVKSQGKLMMPHPPPRPDNLNGQAATDAKNLSVNISCNKNSGIISSKDTSLPHSSGNPVPAQAYNSPETSKSIVTLNNDRLGALQESLSAPTKRYPIYGENGLRLDHTPTDEEIALLWHGVRSALTHRHADFRPGDQPSSNMQSARPNLSHVVIDGDTLLHNWNSLSRVNGFFFPPTNGYITLARRKQIADSNENKRRALLEQRRGRANFASLRAPRTQNLHTLKISPFPSSQEPGQTRAIPTSTEVSESTAQFMLAENLVETSATDGEILAAMQAIQASKQGFLTHKAQSTGPSALSLEERRLLQSLDRLNHRLQNVQEVLVKTPNATNGFTQKSPLMFHILQNRSLSADPRARLQRRY